MPEAGIVLLVEDNPKILDLNRRMLEQEGCVVLAAKTLAEARQRLKIGAPDVAVLDVMLPDGSGVDFLAELRAATDAPVLFLTAKTDREDIMAGLAAGGNDYITKPYDIDEFRMRVKGFLNLARRNGRPQNKNAYLPGKLREKLERVDRFPLTTIVAPAGYGKTTAARIFTGELPPKSKVYRANVLSQSATEFWQDFSMMFSNTAKSFSDKILKLGIPADIATQRAFVRLADETLTYDGNAIYVIIDDFHQLSDPGIKDFFLFSARNLPDHIHIIILSRVPIFSPDELFSLSALINEITERDLWYGPRETKEYFALSGYPISDEDAGRLSDATEGWIAALYLNMKAYVETGKFAETRNIHDLVETALFHPLPERAKELLTAVSLFPAFSAFQAVSVSEMDDAEEILRGLMETNPFITRRESGGVYKLHPLFGDVVRGVFGRLPEGKRREVTLRTGQVYLGEREYVAAERMFYSAGDFDNLLVALEKDNGASLTGENKQEFLTWVRDCPKEILEAHPLAMLICARFFNMYNLRSDSVDTLDALKRILAESAEFTGQERDNLLGEIELSSGFLHYNDIEAMSACHKRACELMDRATNAVSPFVPWTYGSPSVFTSYHRKSGEADRENAALKEAMPYWYKLNQNHGSGAEHLFEGELHFLRGNFTDSIISLHRALHEANRNRQPVLAFAADFLRLRIETFGGHYESVESTLGQMRDVADGSRHFMLRHTVDLCEAWICALAGQPEKAAEWISEGNFEDARLMFPAIHFPHMVYCQLLLTRGEYAALIAREEEERALYKVFPNLLPEIYLDIQLAAAYEQLGRRRTAINHLGRALAAAAPDNIFLPFAENSGIIIEPMREIPDGIWEDHIEKTLALYLQSRMEKHSEVRGGSDNAAFETLTERDQSIARLLASGKSNREIAAELYLSESHVKTLLKRIFQKLGISGEKDKRNILALMFEGGSEK